MTEKLLRNALIARLQGCPEGFRDRGSSSSQLDAVRDHYRASLLRTVIASTASMTNQDQMAALMLKKEMPIDSKKMACVVGPRIRNKRIVVGFWYSFNSRSG